MSTRTCAQTDTESALDLLQRRPLPKLVPKCQRAFERFSGVCTLLFNLFPRPRLDCIMRTQTTHSRWRLVRDTPCAWKELYAFCASRTTKCACYCNRIVSLQTWKWERQNSTHTQRKRCSASRNQKLVFAEIPGSLASAPGSDAQQASI